MDVRATVERLDATGVRVHCLALGGVHLTSPAGKMTIHGIADVAVFNRGWGWVIRAPETPSTH